MVTSESATLFLRIFSVILSPCFAFIVTSFTCNNPVLFLELSHNSGSLYSYVAKRNVYDHLNFLVR